MKTNGQIGFEAYNASTGGKTFDGREIPPWASVAAEKPHVAKAWEDAALAIRDACLDHSLRTTGLTFGEALIALKGGVRVAREGWNGKKMFVYLVPGAIVPFEILRGPAKDAAVKATEIEEGVQGSDRRVCPHVDMKAADGSLVIGWLASQTDMLAEDWTILA